MISTDDFLEFYKKHYDSLTSDCQGQYDRMSGDKLNEHYYSYGEIVACGVTFTISAERFVDLQEGDFAASFRHIPFKLETENFVYTLYLQTNGFFRRGNPIMIGGEKHRCGFLSQDFNIKTKKKLVEEELVIMKLI